MSENVVKLVTREERLKSIVEENVQAAHDEAEAMLWRVIELSKGRKIAGLAIALVFDDGHYGHVVPAKTTDMARLIGATAAMQQSLIDMTND